MTYMKDWFLCSTHPSLPHPAVLPFVSFTAAWSRLWGFFTALTDALTYTAFAFCLVFISGRSRMSLVISVGVPLVVRKWLSLPCFALYPALADVSVTLLWGLVPSQRQRVPDWCNRKRWHRSWPFVAVGFRTDSFSCTSVLLLPHLVCGSTFFRSGSSPDVILCGWLGLKHQLTN